MHIDIISCVPSLLESPLSHSIIKRAQDKDILSINIVNLREYGLGKHRQIDDAQYGGGAGMVLMIEPIANCIDTLLVEKKYDEIIYLTPDGETYNQQKANALSLKKNLLIICGHYKGIDERVREKYVTCEISIGDYVLTGGELAAAVLVDSIGRLLPGVLSDGTSALFDSHQDCMLAPAVYTRPADYDGMEVPKVLLSGNDAKIEEWRYQNAEERTKTRRPDMLED